MKIKIIIIVLVIAFSCTSCFQHNTVETEKVDNGEIISNSTGVNNVNNSKFEKIEFGNKDEIILKTGTICGTENGIFAAIIGSEGDNIYCLDGANHTGINMYKLNEKDLKVVRKPVNEKRVIKLAYITGDWMIWEEDEDKVMFDNSYGKNWAIYAQNMKTEELIEIDREKNIKLSDNSVLIYTAPHNISVSNERFVYTIYDIMEDGNVYAVVKMYDLTQKKEYILDSTKDYEKGFYSYPDIDGDNVVWSYSTCNERFRGDERGYTFLYNIRTKEKKQISSRDDILWPTIYKNYIAARVKPNGLNENSEIVLYEIGRDDSWTTVVSPKSEMYADQSHVELLLPDINGGYLTWGDNVHDDFTVFDVESKKFYKLYDYDKDDHSDRGSFRFSVKANKIITWSEYYMKMSGEEMQYNYKYVILK